MPARLTAMDDGAVDDFWRGPESRLDDRARAAIMLLIDATVSGIARDLERRAGRDAAVGGGATIARRLHAPLLREDRVLMEAFVTQARLDLIDDALPAPEGALPDDPAIRALLAAQGRRRMGGSARGVALSADPDRRLSWWIAAALAPEGDAALAAAVEQRAATIATERAEAACATAAAADALVAATGPAGALTLTIGQGRLALFTASLARLLRCGLDEAAAMTVDRDPALLVAALRSLPLDRATIARIGWNLCEADTGRDADRLADVIDVAMAAPKEEAAAAVAPLSLDRDYRAALAALAREVTP